MTEVSEFAELATFARSLFDGTLALPDEAYDQARRIVLDTVGVIVAGQTVPEVAALHERLGQDPLGDLIAKGAASVSLELDEGCPPARGHPGIHVVPAALAGARLANVSGELFLRAVIAGYEVSARIGSATTLRSEIHPHGTWGAIGAATALGLLRGLSSARLEAALCIAATLPLATHYASIYEGATARNLWSGVGNALGLVAVLSAESGYQGAPGGARGTLGESIGVAFDPSRAVADLGTRWFLSENFFKQYPCCRHAHVAVDAFLQALEGERPDDIEMVHVSTYDRAVVAVGKIVRPETPLQAKFSLPYILSVAAANGTLVREDFEAPNLERNAKLPLASKVVMSVDDALTAMLPRRSAEVRLTMTDGRHVNRRQIGTHGDADDPLSDSEIEQKFLALSSPVLGDAASRQLLETIRALRSSPDVRLMLQTG